MKVGAKALLVLICFILILTPVHAGFFDGVLDFFGGILDFLKHFGIAILTIGLSLMLQQQVDVIPGSNVCGDTIIAGAEHCEGADFLGLNCASFGFEKGNLSCNECRIDVSHCDTPALLSPPENEPQQVNCILPSSSTGETGTDIPPQLIFRWDWQAIYSMCFSNSLDYLENFNNNYCDSTQFTIFLINFFNRMNENNEEKQVFYGNFIADGISSDFRKDFYHYYKNISFLDTPTLFENFEELILDETQLQFVPETITEPGIYLVRVTKSETNWLVEREFIAPPIVESVFYYFPIDGEVGLNLRQGEETPSRNGYGTGFSGEPLILGNTRIDQEITSTNYNVVVRKENSFFSANNEKRGHTFELDLENGELNVLGAEPNLVLLDFGKISEEANPEGAPFFVRSLEGGKTLQLENFFDWHFLFSTDEMDENVSLFERTFQDQLDQNSNCLTQIGGITHYPNTLKQFSNTNAVLAAIIFSPGDYKLAGSCGTEFLHKNRFDDFSESLSDIVLNGPGISSHDISFIGFVFNKKCIYEDIENKKAIIFWNEQNILNELPSCANCQTINPMLQPSILKTGTKPGKIYFNSSVTFWVQFQNSSIISQPDIELIIVDSNGVEEKPGLAFFDDGQNNDFDAVDGIYAATINEGFSNAGKYQYYFKAKDAYGNTLESPIEEFEVFERPYCEIIHLGGNVVDQLNIFIVGDNWSGVEEEYFNKAQSVKEAFLQTPPARDFNSAFNFIVVDSTEGLECVGEKRSVYEEDHDSNNANCDYERIVSTAVSCSLPFKRNQAPLGDKIIVLHNGDLRSNAYLSGQVSQISKLAESTNDYTLGSTSGTAVHELGHNFGLLDFYPNFVTEALGGVCSFFEESNCIMCLGDLSRKAYDCTTNFRDGCNLSVDISNFDALRYGTTRHGVCPESQKELNDYEYMQDLFLKLKEGME